ncbi:MAG TPA: PIN domain-containing protein [Candidatus Aquilonibacter sp.]|nr:PIN domain-containing protein [Candidatus Aquilonibacter sp.]
MAGVLFDTSIYIDALRSGDAAVHARRLAESGPVWLSAVVLAELYAGASGRAVRTVQKLEYDFRVVERLLLPNATDWATAGRALAYLREQFGYELTGRGRVMNEALIAMSAARTGTTVITGNERDFARLAKFRKFSWRLGKP